MPTDDVPPEFFDAVNKFIDLANKLSRKWPTSRVSSVIMYAAARYNAFNFVSLDPDPGKNSQQATEFCCEQYKAMLIENMDYLMPPQADGAAKK